MEPKSPTEPDSEPEQESHPEPEPGVEIKLAPEEPGPRSETEPMLEEPGASTRRTSGPAIARYRTLKQTLSAVVCSLVGTEG